MHISVSMGVIQALARYLGDALPLGSVLVWVVCLGLTALTYRWVERRFERIEVTPHGDEGRAEA